MPPAPGMRELTERQVEEFLENGWLLLEGVIDPQLCAQWREAAWERIGLHPEGPWSESMVRVPPTNSKPISEAAPRAWRAICDLIGGEDRAAAPPNFSDGFALNLGSPDDVFEPPSATQNGWHKDGWGFRHYLDSPEQGLLMLVVYSDIEPESGGTFLAQDSVAAVAKFLVQHPEGIHPDGVQGSGYHIPNLIGQCSDFRELTCSGKLAIRLSPFLEPAFTRLVTQKSLKP